MDERYDAGLLSDYGGGDVDWWQDYIRAELGRSEEFYEGTLEILYTKVAALEAELQAYRDIRAKTKGVYGTRPDTRGVHIPCVWDKTWEDLDIPQQAPEDTDNG